MKAILLLTLSFLTIGTQIGISSAHADSCKQECQKLHKLCKKQKIRECSGDLSCIIDEFEDCRDVRDECKEKCDQPLPAISDSPRG